MRRTSTSPGAANCIQVTVPSPDASENGSGAAHDGIAINHSTSSSSIARQLTLAVPDHVLRTANLGVKLHSEDDVSHLRPISPCSIGHSRLRSCSTGAFMLPQDLSRGASPSFQHLHRHSFQSGEPKVVVLHGSRLRQNSEGEEGEDKNPLLQVSSDYIRLLNLKRPFEKFLAKRPHSIALAETTTSSSSKSGGGHHHHSGTVVKENGDVPSRTGAAPPYDPGDIRLTSIERNHHFAADLESGGYQWKGAASERRRSTRTYNNSEQRQATMKYRLGQRRRLYFKRTRFCDYSVFFAVLGVIITVIDSELCANEIVDKVDPISLALRSAVVITTLALIALIICYHSCEVQLSVIDSGADDWRVAITWHRVVQIMFEVVICIWCPVPGTTKSSWSFIITDSCYFCQHKAASGGHHQLQNKFSRNVLPIEVTTDTILTIPMFLRCYLLGRYMVLNSHQFQDAATRSIAALNRVSVDFKFVLKTMMHENPLQVLIIFAVSYWITISWLFSLCERNTLNDLKQDHQYLSALWFVIVTFLTIGYGDLVPNTYCGRALAVTTGLVGAGVSSALIAVISRKLDLTKAEKHVNAFMADSKLAKERKNVAATVLQETWRIYKFRYLHPTKDDMKIRLHQRRFLAAITNFRRVKWEQRKLTEQSNMLVDIAKVQSDVSEVLWEIQQSHRSLVQQLMLLNDRLSELQQKTPSNNFRQRSLSGDRRSEPGNLL